MTFLARRLLASLVVLLVASYLVYVLSCYAGNPLADLLSTRGPEKAHLIAQRIQLLHLDIPPFLRYFEWFGGVLQVFTGHFTLGSSVAGVTVTSLLGSAMWSTLQLVITATIIAIFIGVIIGITTALRQYSAYDYTATFLSFLFFSLPTFFLAVILKQYVAIGFNNFLQDPVIAPVIIVVVSVVMGVIWLGIVGGNLKKRGITFLIAAAATAAVLIYFSLSKWFNNPTLGPVVVFILSVGAAVLVTTLTTGLANKKSRNAALTMAVLGLILYYPLKLYVLTTSANLITIVILAIVTIAVGVAVGNFWGGVDRWLSARTAAITGVIVGFLLLVNRFMATWSVYANSSYANGRPIATIGSSTPDLEGDFWVHGIDTFTHLLLPTLALMLISLASYSRYARASLLDVMNQDYIRTARAKGLSERTVIMRHAFRNSLIPITTIITLDFGALIGGAVLTETVFGWSGMGALFQSALTNVVDVNVLMGIFVVTGITAIIFNIVADLIYSALDPRIRVGS